MLPRSVSVNGDQVQFKVQKGTETYRINALHIEGKVRFHILPSQGTEPGAKGVVSLDPNGQRSVEASLQQKGYLDLLVFAFDHIQPEGQFLVIAPEGPGFTPCEKKCREALMEMIEEDNDPAALFHAGTTITNDGYIPCSIKALIAYNLCLSACKERKK